MKKLYLLMTIVILMTVGGLQEAKADDSILTTIEWAVNTDYLNASLDATIVFGNGANEVKIVIPVSDLHRQDNGTSIFDIDFYDENDVLLRHEQLQDLFGFTIGASEPYTFNFANLGLTGVAKIYINVPQDFPSASPPVGYLGYINDNTSVEVNYGGLVHGLFNFTRVYSGDPQVNLFKSNDVDIHDQVEFITMASTVNFQLRYGATNRANDDFVSIINFYDINDILLDSLRFNEVIIENKPVGGSFDLSYLNVDLNSVDNNANIEYFNIILVSRTQLILNYLEFLSLNVFYDFNGVGIIDVVYFSEGEVYETFKTVAGAIANPREFSPDPADPNRQFSYWAVSDGSRYNETVLKATDFDDGKFYLYAIFEAIPDPIIKDIVDPNEGGGAELFIAGIDDLGATDPISRTIVFAIIIIVVSVALLVKKVNNFVIILVNGVITGFFIYLGILPLFVTVVLILLLIFLLFSLKGGLSNE